MDPAEALRPGLVDQLAPSGEVESAALAIAATIAARNPVAVAAAKRSVRGSAASVRTAGLQREAAQFVGAVSRPEALARLREFTGASDAARGRTPWRPFDKLRERAEGLRERAEGLRERAEGLRERAEGLRERAEGLRERAEGLREREEGP